MKYPNQFPELLAQFLDTVILLSILILSGPGVFLPRGIIRRLPNTNLLHGCYSHAQPFTRTGHFRGRFFPKILIPNLIATGLSLRHESSPHLSYPTVSSDK